MGKRTSSLIYFVLNVIQIGSALEIIHNVPDFLLEYNTRDTTYKRYKLEDTLDLDELVFNSHAKKDLSSRKPSMSKVYLNNITVMTGRSVQFKCPSVFDPSFTNDIISNDETKINEYLQIKTIIWSHEMEIPQLLSNDKHLFIKNKRYSLKEADIFNSMHLNQQLIQLFGKPKYYDLLIDPVEPSDSGWYSCYVVKRNAQDQNIKYFTFLNIVDDLKSLIVKPDPDLEENKSNKKDDKKPDPGLEKEDSDSYNKIITKKYLKEVNVAKSPSLNVPLSSYTDLGFQIDQTKVHSYFVSTGIFDREKQQVIPLPINDQKKDDANLKRQIANVSIKAMGPEKSEEVELPVAVRSKSTTSPVTRSHISKTFASQNPHEERLSVYPKFLNTSEDSSFQIDCKYKGHLYLQVNLKWYRNGFIFQLQREPRRIISLDYKQNYTRISILKFTNALSLDTGIYKCIAYDENDNHIAENHLKIYINEKSPENMDESYFKYPRMFNGYLISGCYVSQSQSNSLLLVSILLFNCVLSGI